MMDSTVKEAAESSSRSKRQRLDKSGRFAALRKFKQLKGTKNKYEVEELQNVYEEVDEKEYCREVQDRQENDWIVDDDGSGYVEDGRDIFDDDLVEATPSTHPSKRKKGAKDGEGTRKSLTGKKGNIKNMLLNMPTKKKREKEVKIEEDDLLNDIMSELHEMPPPLEVLRPLPTLLKKKVTPIRPTYSPMPKRLAEVPKRKLSVPNVNVKVANGSGSDVSPSQDIEEFESLVSQPSTHTAADDSMDIDITEFDDEMEMPMNGCTASTSKQLDIKIIQNGVTVLNDSLKNALKEEDLKTEWKTTLGSNTLDTSNIVTGVYVDNSQLPLVETESGEKVLEFYWLDAYEDYFKNNGTVYLFGKVFIESAKTYVSCCVTVKSIQRKVYILPREKRMNLKTKVQTDDPVGVMDVYQEFNSTIAEKLKIYQFKSRKVTKHYSFEKVEVPSTSEYLEVKYSASHAPIPANSEGETFSHIFGTNTTSLEMLLMECKIRGPCWLQVKCPKIISPCISWCKVEAVVLQPENISLIRNKAPPPLVLMALVLQTIINPSTLQNEVVMAGCLTHYNFYINKAPPEPPFQQHFCCVTHPVGEVWPYDHKTTFGNYNATKLEKMDSERSLLTFLLTKIYKIDPDVIVGHDLYGFDFDILLHRLNLNKISHWSRLGRLKRANVVLGNVKGRNQLEKSVMAGRLICDLKISAKELIRAKSYDLQTLCQQVLRIKEKERVDLTTEDVRNMYGESSSIIRLINLTMQDGAYVLRILCELNVLPLALQITTIVGNLMSRTLLGGRAERNEYLLLHAFHEKDFIVPDKKYGKAVKQNVVPEDNDGEQSVIQTDKKSRKKPAYAGGLVLEPKKGFYDNYILLMDFNSLYPSIIQEYNICFTTVVRSTNKNADDDSIPELPEPDLEFGILPTEIRKLVESRKQVKGLMKQENLSPDLKMQYDIRQKALKLTANSMYGCLGFTFSRFYAKPLAAMVTAKGREILLQTKDLVQGMNLDVIYGDTDSIMINSNCTNYDEVFKLGNKIKSEVNKLYKLLELEVDGVFKYMLLLKKKKYAALTITKLPNGQFVEEQELKGLDIVRRDWSQLSADAGRFVVSQVLSDQNPDERIEHIHSYLEHIAKNLELGKIPLKLLSITKQLTRSPEEYHDSKGLSHVSVALRWNASGRKKLKQGDTVAYVICEDGTTNAASQRAYHIEEMKSNKDLKVDIKYYLSQQVHPVVSRLCDPIDGTDAARIAGCLGLDTSGYRHVKHDEGQNATAEGGMQLSDEEKFKNCERFTFKCVMCQTEITMDKAFNIVKGKPELVFSRCENVLCALPPWNYAPAICNLLRLSIKKHMTKYYAGWLTCSEDPTCTNRTRNVTSKLSIGGFPQCDVCETGVMKREYSDYKLYLQLSFYQYIFDVKRCTEHLPETDRERLRNLSTDLNESYGMLKHHVEGVLRRNAYSQVDLGKLFSGLYPTTKTEAQSNIKKQPS